ncbi:MAG TPA: hypothetical protein VFV67_09320 [Actinophytocola sp.]|uniref:hypothetical protein n=1 Tax=Actinophytocola sp. TaxID=1872138 RepID=UPI002DBD5DCA|nr:hypothetical protein [Actinophytocola sp.]HEU5470840.1 hypothetical protein [Actinophytocola sp.]
MSDEKPAEQPKPADETPPDKPRAAEESPADAGDAKPPSRDEALHRLRGDGAELDNLRFNKIIAEGLGHVEDVANINIFQGAFTVEGDFTAGGTHSRPARRLAAKTRLEPKQLEERLAYYVPPVGFKTGVDILYEGNLAIFSGPARTGRESRALATVVEALRRCGLTGDVLRLDGNVLGNMSWRVPQRHCGLIVLDRPHGQGRFAAESIDDDWLSRAGDQLREHGSFLVVITGPVGGSLATAALRTEFVLEDMELPPPMEIVRARVAGELPLLAEDEVERQLSETQLGAIFEERDDPAFATRAAMVTVEALRTGADLDAAIVRLRDPEDQVREWLGADPDAAEVAWVLATAALEGSSYLNVADAAVGLCRELGAGPAGMGLRYFRRLLAERSWIEHAAQPDGSAAVRFRHDKLRHVVLALSWFELDGARSKILQWLTGLADHPDVEVRARAAGAAGILAMRDFEHSLHRYLVPWGSSRSVQLRQSAAQGMNVVGSVEANADTVWEQLEQWAEMVRFDIRERNLPATAGLAAGGPLGVADPRRALRVLRTLVCDGDWGLLEPAAFSTHLLLEAGCVHQVLDALMEWTEAAVTEEPVVKALTMFAFAAREPGSAETAASDRPVLMLSAWEHREQLPELWGRALSCEPVRSLAMDALRAWVRVADADRSVHGVVLDLLAGIADRGDQDYGRLCYALREWAVDPDEPSDAAAAFYREIREAGELTA